jgi:hypothetical protein
MEFFVDRRNERHARMQTENSVELLHEDFEEPFEADCVDLSPGGAAVRASCLPEVGASFICRFEGEDEGESVEVLGTVVWVHVEGDRKGEFGLRFLNVDDRTEDLIETILRKSGFDDEDPYQPRAEDAPAVRTASVSQLYLDGVSTPIAARIMQSRDGTTVFEQELPLLRIQRGVSARQPGAEPRRGTIAAVQLRVEGDTPKLVITVRHQGGIPDEGLAAEPAELREATPPAEPDVQQEEEGVSDWEPVIAALEGSAPPPVDVEPQPTPPTPPAPAQEREAPRPVSGSQDLFELSEDEDEDVEWPREPPGSLRAFARANLAIWKGALGALGTVLLAAFHTLTGRLRGQTLPAMARKAQGARERTEGLVKQRIAPWLVSAVRRIRLPRMLQRRRRTTAFHPAAERPARSRNRAIRDRAAAFGKALLLPTLAMGGGLLAAYGFGTWWSGEEIIPLHRLVGVATAPAEQAAGEEVSSPASASEQRAKKRKRKRAAARRKARASKPEAVDSPPAAVQNERTASVAAATRTPAPAAKADKPARSKQQARSVAAPVFGSRKLAGGRNYVLRMSQTIRELRGTPDEGGFTVIIPGSLSFDPAGPIAAAHPLVRRSLVLNKGDHAALTIRFVKGASPAYRVSAVGSSLHITIAESS